MDCWFGSSASGCQERRSTRGDRPSDRSSEVDGLARELSHNRLPSGRYSPRIERDRALRTFVVDRLAEGWTPEHISGQLKGGNEPALRAVGCETIYAFIYRAGQQAERYGVISRAGTNAAARADRDLRKIPSRIASPSTNGPRRSTPEPRAATGRVTSSFVSAHGRCSFSVLHERKSRVTLAARLAGKTAAETISVMLAVFARSQPALRKSITFDNDTAFAQHAMLRTMRAMTTWFCDAHASWQKGRIENVNGRLRR